MDWHSIYWTAHKERTRQKLCTKHNPDRQAIRISVHNWCRVRDDNDDDDDDSVHHRSSFFEEGDNCPFIYILIYCSLKITFCKRLCNATTTSMAKRPNRRDVEIFNIRYDPIEMDEMEAFTCRRCRCRRHRGRRLPYWVWGCFALDRARTVRVFVLWEMRVGGVAALQSSLHPSVLPWQPQTRPANSSHRRAFSRRTPNQKSICLNVRKNNNEYDNTMYRQIVCETNFTERACAQQSYTCYFV